MSLHCHLRPDTDAALNLPVFPLTTHNDYNDANKIPERLGNIVLL